MAQASPSLWAALHTTSPRPTASGHPSCPNPSERNGLFLGHLRSLVPYFGKQFLSVFYPHVVLGMCHSSLSLAQLGRLSAGSGRDDQGFSRRCAG